MVRSILDKINIANPLLGLADAGLTPSEIKSLIIQTLEPFFHDNATRWTAALRDAGADVVMRERVLSHGAALWRGEFPLMVAWAFGR